MQKTLLSDRAVIRLSPSDSNESVRDFLQGLVTQDVDLLRGPEPLWAALLTPQGKCLYDFILWADGDDVLIDCEAIVADALVKRLSMYRLRRKITIALERALHVHWTKPPADLHGRLPSSEGMEGLRPTFDPRMPQIGHRWLSAEIADDTSAIYRAHRLSCNVTEGQAELGEGETLWLECNAVELNGVSFKKGCYVGQENTARMNWRQKINRRMAVVPLEMANEKRQRVAYPELGYSVELRRLEDLAGIALPEWLQTALSASHE